MEGDGGTLRLLGWLALVVAVVLQVAGLYSQGTPQPGGVPGLDKVAHLVAFAVPAALARLLGVRWVLVALVAHALVSEPLQHQVAPHRQLDALDTVADLVGIGAGWLFGGALVSRSRARPVARSRDGRS
ncbi:VanZ family protein [Ornithinimicrobium avium]|uniref:VanZ family protein n=1 Tax=Ornithinimicrobium avium TaxID=2283195 RepID=A0A345NIH7_9MICO|nr:VanZ family protein [Ornithinimicrobium avium]AXH94835.1 VanZ family protein [Ornithinimicrobium avium]